MYKTKIFTLIFALLSVFFTGKIVSQITWSKVFGGNLNDEGWFAAQTIDGNYLMISYDEQRGPNLIKYSQTGIFLWQKFLPDTLSEARNFAEDPSGNVYFVTINEIVKADVNGNINWVKNIPVSEGQFYLKVNFIDSFKNLLILGNNCVCKADSSGNIKWQKIYSLVDYDIYFYDQEITQEAYYFVGTRKSNYPEMRGYILKSDTSGNIIWDKYSGFSSRFYDLSKNSDKTFIACGYRSNSSSGYYLVKFDVNSNYLWEKTGLPDSTGVCSSIYKVNTNNYVMASTNGQGKGKVINIDSNGNILNNIQHYYHGLDWAMYNSIMGCSDSGFVIAAYYEFNENGLTDCLLIKTDKFGNTIPIGIEPISNSIPEQFKLYQNFPNPFNPTTKIKFEIPSVGHNHFLDMVFTVYDITGREVYEISATKPAGIYEMTFDGSKLTSGIYIYTLRIGEFSQTQKMILLK